MGKALMGKPEVSSPLAVPSLGTVPESTGAFFTDLGNVVAFGSEVAGTSSLGDSTSVAGAEPRGALGFAGSLGSFALDAGGDEDGSFEAAVEAALALPGALTPELAERVGAVAASVELGLGSLPATLAAGALAAALKAIDAPTNTTMTASAQASHFLFCICPH